MNINTNIDLGNGLILKNPVLTASGTFGYGKEYEDFIDLNKLGGIIVKGTTLNPREGNPYPRMAETPSGMLNAVGLQNKGVDYFINTIYPKIENLKTNIIVNVSGNTPEDYAEVCRRLSRCKNVTAVEVNISCPNVKQGGMAFGTTCEGAALITSAVRNVWDKHLITKLSPNVTDIVSIAKSAQDAGADSLSLINTLLGMAVDIKRRKPVLSTVTGGLSGPCVKPVALRMVWQVSKAVSIPVIGLGGIMSGEDALEFIMAGASAVQIGTANFINPSVTIEAINQINEYCELSGIKDLAEIRGII
ncbi:MAG: dihydroorotate dehydrogenase [Prevotella sp.]|nr:dihydroorotate dehydrogenase [Bacteroides sp.]MCM1365853.1 dihydroorotate dehydrogenase [Prevotella sp.]